MLTPHNNSCANTQKRIWKSRAYRTDYSVLTGMSIETIGQDKYARFQARTTNALIPERWAIEL
jgi:hypothetical protein